jgi:hypothetical protein
MELLSVLFTLKYTNNRVTEVEQMNSKTHSIKCKLCLTPLNGQQEFIGHQIHSHELSLTEAWKVWKMSAGLQNSNNNINASTKIQSQVVQVIQNDIV